LDSSTAGLTDSKYSGCVLRWHAPAFLSPSSCVSTFENFPRTRLGFFEAEKIRQENGSGIIPRDNSVMCTSRVSRRRATGPSLSIAVLCTSLAAAKGLAFASAPTGPLSAAGSVGRGFCTAPRVLRGGGSSGRTDSPSIGKINANAMADPVMPPPGGGSNVLVIGVAGGSGGGKSVFCTKLESMLEQICPTIVISHDSYYKNKVDVDRECEGNWDCPIALHTSELVRDLNTLKAGGEVNVPIYSFANNARVQDQSTLRQFAPGTRGVLLLEGLMVLHDEELRSRMDIRVYVDCDEDTRFMRRLARDTHPLKGRGRTVADVYGAWARNVKPNHHKYVEPTKRYAHMIIPHHGLWADPGHLLAVGEDPSSLLDAYVTRVSLVDNALKEEEWKGRDGPVAKALEQVTSLQSCKCTYYTYAYRCLFICIIHVYIYRYIYKYMHTRIYIDVYVYIYKYTHIYKYIYTRYIDMHTLKFIFIFINVYTCVYTYMCMYI